MNYASNQNGKVQEETLAYSNSLYLNSIYFKIILPLFQVFQNLFSFICHFVTYNREYYEWLCRLRRYIQVGRLPLQGTWLGLLTLSVM